MEVVLSSRPGVGKTLKVQRYTEKLKRDILHDEDRVACVTVPLQEAIVDKDAIVKALLPNQDESFSSPPMIYHLDVAPMVSAVFGTYISASVYLFNFVSFKINIQINMPLHKSPSGMICYVVMMFESLV